MAANTPVRSKWLNGPVVLGSELDTLDGNLATLLNGDGGGTWAPSPDALSLSGAGFWLLGPNLLQGSSKVTTPAASGVRIVHNDNDYTELGAFHPGSTQTMLQNFVDARYVRGQAIAFSTEVTTAHPGATIALALRVRDNCNLASVALTFAVLTTHASVPAALPKARVIAVAKDGSVSPLILPADGADAAGWKHFPTPVSGAAWTNSHSQQTWTLTMSIGPRTIARKGNAYWLEIQDEQGANAFAPGDTTGNQWFSAKLTFTNIADTRPE